MYARCLRRAAVGSTLRRKVRSPTTQRCLATLESTSTASSSTPPFDILKDETGKNVDSWDSAFGVSSSNESSQRVVTSEALTDVSEGGIELDETENEEENADRQSKQSRTTNHSPGIVVTSKHRSKDMPSVFAIVRQIEQRFGRVREFRALRDKDSPTDYLSTLFITFCDDGSIEKIKDVFQGGDSGRIILDGPSNWDSSQQLDGGVRLVEIQPFLRPSHSETAVTLEIDPDIRTEEPADASDTTLGSSEKLDGSEPLDPSQVSTSASVDGLECIIRVKHDSQASMPYFHNRVSRFSKAPESRKRLAHAFVRWAGFYPHYRFTKLVPEAQTNGSGAVSGERETMDAVQLATRTMNDAIFRFRRRLHDYGDPNHGLTYRDGRLMMPECDAPVEVEQTEPKPAVTSSPVTAQHDAARPSTKADLKLTNTKWEKSEPLTPEEEENIERLVARSNVPHSHRDSQSLRSPVRTPVMVPKAPPASTRPNYPETTVSSKSDTEVTSEQTQDPSPTKTLASESPLSDTKEQATEAENNRMRRARKKAEQERAGFKARLLGLFGR